MRRFGSQTLVVRSSSLSEDGFVTANAGKFESLLNVQPTSEALRQAIEAVIASYGGQNNSADQVLIQPMLHNVKLSGVIFTRTLTYGASYHVVNYAQKDTAAVTGGSCKSDETFYHWKYSKIPSNAPNFYPKLFKAVREIETLVQFDALDIEFAVTDDDALYTFQVDRLHLKNCARLPTKVCKRIWRMRSGGLRIIKFPIPIFAGEKRFSG